MNTFVKKIGVLVFLLIAIGFAPFSRSNAQTFKTLYTFTNPTNSNPLDLNLSGNTLYGATSCYLFKLNIGASVTSVLGPYCHLGIHGLTVSGSTIFCTSIDYNDGSPGGSLFAVNTDGTGLRTLHNFNSDTEGGEALSLLMQADTLYGLLSYYGAGGAGGIFSFNTNTSEFRLLHSFSQETLDTDLDSPAYGLLTNNDGVAPLGFILMSDTLYGAAAHGGLLGVGNLFSINLATGVFSNFYNFTAEGEAAHPRQLVAINGFLYGVTRNSSSNGDGIVFRVGTNGTGFTVLHSFLAPFNTDPNSPSFNLATNQEGAELSYLIPSGNTLLGLASMGGPSGNGTIFAINTDGTGFTNLYFFTPTTLDTDRASIGFGSNTNIDGAWPSDLLLSGNTLYGTAWSGGAAGLGTVFSISLPVPKLTIRLADTNAILSWPMTQFGAFTLQSTTNIFSQGWWSPVSILPILFAGQNVVTNAISQGQEFYRLSGHF